MLVFQGVDSAYDSIPSWELAYPPTNKNSWVDDFSFTQVGYVSSLEANMYHKI